MQKDSKKDRKPEDTKNDVKKNADIDTGSKASKQADANEQHSAELEDINKHRLPIAKHIRRFSLNHAAKQQEKSKEKAEKKAKKQQKRMQWKLKHPDMQKHAVIGVVVAGFAGIIIYSFIIGNRIVVSKNKNTISPEDTISASSLYTSKEQQTALRQTGLYDTFELYDGMPIASVLDGHITPADASACQEILQARAEQQAQADSENSASNADSNENSSDNAENDNADNTITNSMSGGQGIASGNLNSDQMNEGKNTTMNAVNEYLAEKQNELQHQYEDLTGNTDSNAENSSSNE